LDPFLKISKAKKLVEPFEKLSPQQIMGEEIPVYGPEKPPAILAQPSPGPTPSKEEESSELSNDELNDLLYNTGDKETFDPLRKKRFQKIENLFQEVKPESRTKKIKTPKPEKEKEVPFSIFGAGFNPEDSFK
jgi:hypothetical protein